MIASIAGPDSLIILLVVVAGAVWRHPASEARPLYRPGQDRAEAGGGCSPRANGRGHAGPGHYHRSRCVRPVVPVHHCSVTAPADHLVSLVPFDRN